MTQPKFTPGPWHTESATDKRSEGFVRQSPDEDGCCVAICRVTSASRSFEEFQANAALIAAAPDMYAALEGLLDRPSSAARLLAAAEALAKAGRA